MKLLFIQSFLNEDYHAFKHKIAVVGFVWLLVAIAIIIDLISGVRKAKERGEMRTSYGFKQTVNKVVLYYTFMLFALLIDCIGTFFYPLPFVTFIAAGFLIFIEAKSFFEKAHDKDKRKFNKSLQELAIILENKEDLVKGLAEIVKQKIKEDKENENN